MQKFKVLKVNYSHFQAYCFCWHSPIVSAPRKAGQARLSGAQAQRAGGPENQIVRN